MRKSARRIRRIRRTRRRTGTRRPGITRVDQPSTRTHGYVARVGWHRRRGGGYGPRHQAFFGDVSHGGKRGALRAAAAWLALVQRAAKKKSRKKPGRRAA